MEESKSLNLCAYIKITIIKHDKANLKKNKNFSTVILPSAKYLKNLQAPISH